MAIEPVKVPQNVYVEDRIIGPVTLKQIIICLLSAGFSYMIFATVKAAGALDPVSMAISWTPTVIGAAFAFVKINGISLFRFCLLMIERLDKPAHRTWTPRRGITINISTGSAAKEEDAVATVDAGGRRTSDIRRIRELSAVLDRGPEESELFAEEAPVAEGPAPDAVPTVEDLPEEEVRPLPRLQAAMQSARPVDPARVRAEPLQTEKPVVDGIGTKPALKTPAAKPEALIRDIRPPARS